MNDTKKIYFGDEMTNTWEEVETFGNDCPSCKNKMICMFCGEGLNSVMYAYCPKCKKYFKETNRENLSGMILSDL